MSFVQIIDFATERFEEAEALMEEWIAATAGRRSAQRGLLGRERQHPDRYVMVVEFPSAEEAAANSKLPETSEFAEKLARLCTSPPAFRDLDLVRLDQLDQVALASPPGVRAAHGRVANE